MRRKNGWSHPQRPGVRKFFILAISWRRILIVCSAKKFHLLQRNIGSKLETKLCRSSWATNGRRINAPWQKVRAYNSKENTAGVRDNWTKQSKPHAYAKRQRCSRLVWPAEQFEASCCSKFSCSSFKASCHSHWSIAVRETQSHAK